MKHWLVRTRTLVALASLTFAVPYTAFGAGIFNGTIVPRGACLCPGSAPSWGCILQLIQNGMNALVGIGILLCVIWIAYAGFSMMTSGGVAEARSLAKTRLLNAVIGIVVILSAWLMIDFVMKFIYDPTVALDGSVLGPWNSLLAPEGDSYCLVVTNPSGLSSGWQSVLFTSNGASSAAPSNQIGVAKGLCADNNTACSVQALMSTGLSQRQAQAMSCISVTESGGNPSIGYSPTGACGLFQITTRPGNWSNPAYHSGTCSTSSSCGNAYCNRQTAVMMFKAQSYQPWTGKNANGTYWNPNAVACVAKYDPR